MNKIVSKVYMEDDKITLKVKDIENGTKEKVEITLEDFNSSEYAFNPKVEAAKQSFKPKKKTKTMFNESGDIKKSINDFYSEDLINYKKSYGREILKKANKFVSIKNKITEILESEELTNKFFDKVKFGKKQSAAKILVEMKQEGYDINIKEKTLKIDNYLEDGEMLMSFGLPPQIDKPKFLKYHCDKFAFRDLEILMQELNTAMTHADSLNSEDIRVITDLRTKIEYMYRTGYISDAVVLQVIDIFNKRFKRDLTDEYNNPQSMLGFRNAEESMQNKIAMGINSIPMAPTAAVQPEYL